MKKLLSFLLVCALLMSAVPCAVYAEDDIDNAYATSLTWPEFLGLPNNVFLYPQNARIDFDEADIDAYAASLLNDSTYNSAKTGSSWYASASTVEVVARVIYGENNVNLNEQTAIMWVIVNRYNYSGNRYPNDFKEIVIDSGEFSALNSSLAKSQKSANDEAWQHATWLACLLMMTDNATYIRRFASPPAGIYSQRKFIALSSVVDYIDDGVFRNNTSANCIEYRLNNTWCQLSSVSVVPNDGSSSGCYGSGITSVEELQEIIDNLLDSSWDDVSDHNLFYNMTNE